MIQVEQEIKQEISNDIEEGRRYINKLQSGLRGFAGQVGRLTDQLGIQYIADPNQPEGYRVINTRTPGQFSHIRAGWVSFRVGIKDRFGI